MPKVNIICVALAGFFLLSFCTIFRVGYSIEPVIIEFFYYDPSTHPLWCSTCPSWQLVYATFLHNNETVDRIQNDYGDQVSVEWIDFYSSYGQEKIEQYNIVQWNSMTINYEVVIEGVFNETYIGEIIDAYLLDAYLPPPARERPQSPQPNPSPSPVSLSFTAVLMLAFSFGFFETFSPCLIIMLSFIISYTIGEVTRFKKSFLKVMLFGIGFVSAAVLLGLAFGLVFLSMPALQISLTWVACIFAIFFGFNLLGLLKAPFQTKPIVKKLARTYVITFTGIFILGFIFYFLDPCIAPIFISMVPLLFLDFLPLILFAFSVGAIIPFMGIGIFAGSVSKLARSTYRHRFKIRAISGSILIGYAIYLIVLYLLPKLIR